MIALAEENADACRIRARHWRPSSATWTEAPTCRPPGSCCAPYLLPPLDEHARSPYDLRAHGGTDKTGTRAHKAAR